MAVYRVFLSQAHKPKDIYEICRRESPVYLKRNVISHLRYLPRALTHAVFFTVLVFDRLPRKRRL